MDRSAGCDVRFLEAGGVEVWSAALETAGRWTPLLSREEQERALRLQGAQDRARFIAGRTLLRRLLAPLTGLEATSIPLRLSSTGKPALDNVAGEDMHFSLTHAGGYVMAAIALGREVGIDLEAPRAVPDPVALARRFFHPAETAAIAAATADDRLELFRRCWTRKEAVVKAWGTGVAGQFKQFSVPLDATIAAHPIERAGAVWLLRDSPVPAAGYTAALTVRGEECRILSRVAD